MLASVFIIAISLVLLLYWFRYTCLLLLQANPASQHAGAMARANRLAFPMVRKALDGCADQSTLDVLHRSLDNDYRIILYLLEHTTDLDLPAIERRMLVMDYRVMRVWYRLARSASGERARQALIEMSEVLGYFSQKMGERAAQHAAA